MKSFIIQIMATLIFGVSMFSLGDLHRSNVDAVMKITENKEDKSYMDAFKLGVDWTLNNSVCQNNGTLAPIRKVIK